jgi:hypothetical protein
MDTKVIAMVGAVIVVGAAVYGVATGTVLPGTEDITEEPPAEEETPTPPGPEEDQSDTVDNGGGNGGSDGGVVTGEDSGDNETLVGNETQEVTDTGPEPLPIVCEEQGGNIGRDDVVSVPSAASSPLDPPRAESMIHNALNKVRGIHSDAAPLKCDPALREVARDHGRLILIQEGARGSNYVSSDYEATQKRIRELGGDIEIQDNIGEMSADDVEINETRLYEREGKRVCENPSLEYGTFAYGIDIENANDFAAADFAGDQELTIISNHQDLVRDVRRMFVDDLGSITDASNVRQGIGVTVERKTNEVVVTRILCGPRGEQTQE